jgi:hypothetical protein
MIIGERIRELREATNFSRGDIEKRTGLLRCDISRVENGQTVPVPSSALGFSQPYAAKIRAGRPVPHPRHWLDLARQVEMTHDW